MPGNQGQAVGWAQVQTCLYPRKAGHQDGTLAPPCTPEVVMGSLLLDKPPRRGFFPHGA